MPNPSNPNGANQYQLDPRQKMCWDAYVDPRSETFGNALQSALKAGYEPDYCEQITSQTWFKERLRRMNLLGKAEKVLDETLEIMSVNEKGEHDSALVRAKLEAAKFVASTQGKHEGYSTKTETDITSGGEKLDGAVFNIVKPE